MKKIILSVIIALFLQVGTSFASFGVSPLKFEYDLNNFNVIQDKIKIINQSDSPITLYSSTEDFIAGDDSWNPKFIRPEDQVNAGYTLSNWIRVEDRNITLAPRESREINFSIQIPRNAEPGWHYAAIFFAPWIAQNAQVAVVQRLWVLVLVNVPGDVIIQWEVKNFDIGLKQNETFTPQNNFSQLPITFQTLFKNDGNVHLKPNGKITLLDENKNILKNVWKKSLMSPSGTFLWETLVDYIPINESLGNVLSKSERKFENIWEWFWYTVLNPDGTRSVLFKDINTYYKETAQSQAQFLMFWESIKTRTVNKKITALFELSYTGKDAEVKDFNEEKEFFITYEEQYIGLNTFLLVVLAIVFAGIWYYVVKILPQERLKKEEELRKKILEEIEKNK